MSARPKHWRRRAMPCTRCGVMLCSRSDSTSRSSTIPDVFPVGLLSVSLLLCRQRASERIDRSGMSGILVAVASTVEVRVEWGASTRMMTVVIMIVSVMVPPANTIGSSTRRIGCLGSGERVWLGHNGLTG